MITRDILNTGVKPSLLLECVRENFEAAGGTVMERAALDGVDVRPDGVRLDVSPAPGGGPGPSERSAPPAPLTARLIVDCMGFGSPVVRQARHGQRPDGVCLVVGSCARGFEPDENRGADLIYTCTDIREDYQGQYFWEAFPAGSGPRDRTTYMFTYVDADPSRPSLASLLDDYWDLMPRYQGLDSIEQVDLRRVLFGYFPTYRDSRSREVGSRHADWGRVRDAESAEFRRPRGASATHRTTDGRDGGRVVVSALDGECPRRSTSTNPRSAPRGSSRSA